MTPTSHPLGLRLCDFSKVLSGHNTSALPIPTAISCDKRSGLEVKVVGKLMNVTIPSYHTHSIAFFPSTEPNACLLSYALKKIY